jgi:hypothetical protein
MQLPGDTRLFYKLYKVQIMKILIRLFLLCFSILTAGCGGHSNEVNRIAAEIYSKSNLQKLLPPRAFKSDGCSCFPDGNWVECCIRHDLAYWAGGTGKERLDADRELEKCVSEKGYPITAFFMYYGVRVGGVWWLPTPFRWGFGWDYPQSGSPDKPY